MNDILNADKESISEIEGFGDIMAENIVSALKEPHRIQLIKRLENLGVNMIYSKKSAGDGRFKGLTFVLTGTLPTLKRDEAKKFLHQYQRKHLLLLPVRTQEVSLIKQTNSE